MQEDQFMNEQERGVSNQTGNNSFLMTLSKKVEWFEYMSDIVENNLEIPHKFCGKWTLLLDKSKKVCSAKILLKKKPPPIFDC